MKLMKTGVKRLRLQMDSFRCYFAYFLFLFFNFSLPCDHVILFIERLWVLSIQPKRFEAGNFGKFRDILEIVKFPNRPRSIYQYSNMAPRLSGQKCKFLKFFFVSQAIPKRDLDTKKLKQHQI